jgi:hypothetical protein
MQQSIGKQKHTAHRAAALNEIPTPEYMCHANGPFNCTTSRCWNSLGRSRYFGSLEKGQGRPVPRSDGLVDQKSYWSTSKRAAVSPGLSQASLGDWV